MPCLRDLLVSSLHFAGNLVPSNFHSHSSNGNLQVADQHSLLASAPPATITATTPASAIETLPPNVDFQAVLASLPQEDLRAALHAHLPSKYKDGMFERASHAVEAIHHSDPTLATRLVAAARYDLIRRQNGNLTTTSNTPAPPVIVPIPVTTTNAQGSTVQTTVTALSQATASVIVQVTSVNAQGQTVTTSQNVPAVVQTNAQGQVTTAPAPTLNAGGEVVVTSTNGAGSVVVTTITPDGGVVSSIVLQTTTLPDGSRSTRTSYTVVPAKASATAGSPSLQKGSAQGRREGTMGSVTLGGVLVAALVFGAALL